MLDLLHKHLAQLRRDNLLKSWTDAEIPPGGKIGAEINTELSTANLFIALVSPDYIASNYCFDVEFNSALKRASAGSLTIIPIIIEPCDWLSTPLKDFKALPKDGKAISTWENRNTAFLDVIQNIRKVVQSNYSEKPAAISFLEPRNYRVEKDFDSIEKIEFTEKTFNEIRTILKRFIAEVSQLDNVKARIIDDNDKKFTCILVNRNKIAAECELKVTIEKDTSPLFRSSDQQINYTIANSKRSFTLSNDKYRLYWQEQAIYSRDSNSEWTSQTIADAIWTEWLQNVGIL